jgi:general secretion pathway protein G
VILLNKTRRYQRQLGFTFLEIIVVVAILGMLATVLIVNYSSRTKDTQIQAAQLGIKNLSSALELYKLDNGFYPTTEQGLKALLEKPTSAPEPKKWKQYIESMPRDPWNNDYVYIQPGNKKDFDLYSKGPDGIESEEDDITNWVKDKDKNSPSP